MANVTITQLPTAGAITGSELVPVVQNGQTVQTTALALVGSPVQTQTFITLSNEPTLANSRYLGATNGLTLTASSPQGVLNVTTTGALSSLVASGNGFQVKTDATTLAGRTITVSGSGLSISDGDGIAGNPTVSLTNPLATIATNGFVPIAYGGTGQVTASAAFNALSPITSTGDLIVGNGANSATRLAIGANSYVLTSNGTTATWAAVPIPVAYPGAGIVVSTGSAWDTSYTTSGSGTVVALATGASLTTPTLTNPTITNYTETRYAATVTGNAITLTLTNGTFQTITTMAGANAITLPNVSSGKSLTVQIAYASTPTTLTFAAGVGTLKWPAGTTPTATLTNGKYDFYSFVSDGTNWYGAQTGANF